MGSEVADGPNPGIPCAVGNTPTSSHSYGVTPRTGFAAADGLHVQHDVTVPQFLRAGDGGALGRLVDADGTTRSQPRPTMSRGGLRW